MNRIKAYIQIPSSAPYAWFVYIMTAFTTQIVFGTGSGKEFFSYIFITAVNAVPSIAAVIQITVNTYRLVKGKTKLNLQKIIINILLVAAASLYGSLIPRN